MSSPDPPSPSSPLETVYRYHQATKHEFNRFARSLGYLDWANQPDPFRRYHGAPLFPLPHLTLEQEPVSPSYESLFESTPIPTQPVTLETLSRFFEYALSLTAWKEYNETRWALRSNPSSGNLHPTEGYLVISKLPELTLEPGVYHYAPKEHALEHRWDPTAEYINPLFEGFPRGSFLVGLTSIHWREAWKYGERAFRYCQHDTGHAIGTLRIAAATLGWNLVLLQDTSDQTIEQLLGLTRSQDFEKAEREYPELIAAVWPQQSHSQTQVRLTLPKLDQTFFSGGTWRGKANRLSKDDQVIWEIIDEVTAASRKEEEHTDITSHEFARQKEPNPNNEGQGLPTEDEVLAGQIIHQRRSAVAFDGRTGLSSSRFFTMLRRIMPQGDQPVADRPMPWDAIPWHPTVHFALFVHRVPEIPPGLYWLNRSPERRHWSYFQARMHQQFSWAKPRECPPDLPLYLLEEGNAQQLAMQLSCGQEIASDSAFALGMVAEFDETLQEFGPWFYKRLFWETGLIGQVLYLEAEAAGIRSTGIGCFFDDPVHRVFGFHPQTIWQSLYHFTVGGPLDDGRLTTLPPYGPHVM